MLLFATLLASSLIRSREKDGAKKRLKLKSLEFNGSEQLTLKIYRFEN